MNTDSFQERAARIKLLLMDCDGVLTDGRVWILEGNDDQKAFNTRDGLGLDLFHRAGLLSGVISGRFSHALERRAATVKMSYVRVGCDNKNNALTEILTESGLSEAEVAFVGDDLNDVPLLRRVGFAVAVGDAAEEAKAHAHYITSAHGGKGAIREVCEAILKSQGLWSKTVTEYLNR